MGLVDNIFNLCRQVREEYRHFSLDCFIRADDVRRFVHEQGEKQMWDKPPLLQINPRYQACVAADGVDLTIGKLCELGELHHDWLRLPIARAAGLALYRHQYEALDAAKRGEHYVLSAGTGSGKSLGYILPIVDQALRDKAAGIRAIVCYPMNALVNSQLSELDKYFRGSDVRYERYTGQENAKKRAAIAANPPDILLTNFMMLELMLTRNMPDEMRLLAAAAKACDFLVMDELHTYRGRQGADVAMLIRRLRRRLGRDFLCVGTSATLGSEVGAGEAQNAAAAFASRLFGVTVKPANVVAETLERITRSDWDEAVAAPRLEAEMAAGVEALTADAEALRNSAMAVWCEFQFGVCAEEARLTRARPQTIEAAAETLAQITRRSKDDCVTFLHRFFARAARDGWDGGGEGFAVRLHQFFSGPGEAMATLEGEGARRFSVTGEKKSQDGKPFFAMRFCRECGHEFHPVWRREGQFVYRSVDDVGDEKDGEEVAFGFVCPLVREMRWTGDGEDRGEGRLPDEWLEEDKKGNVRVRRAKRAFLPRRVRLDAEGCESESGGVYVFLPGKFRFCPKCGDTHVATGRDGVRLAGLNGEGRSSATTMLLLALLGGGAAGGDGEAKTLAFSDNRQDAALQAGYFNDFVFTLKLRAGLLRALEEADGKMLGHDVVAERVTNALGFAMAELMAVESGQARRMEFLVNADNAHVDDVARSRDTLRDIVGYHLLHDLRRGWRHNNPNLQKIGMLELRFGDLRARLGDLANWRQPVAFVRALTEEKRVALGEVFMTYLLEERCVNSPYMEAERIEGCRNRAQANLLSVWYDGGKDWLAPARIMTLEARRGRGNEERVARGGARSRLGGRVRPMRDWLEAAPGMMSGGVYGEVATCVLETLRRGNFVVKKPVGGLEGWQVNSDCLQWRLRAGEEEAAGRGRYYRRLYARMGDMLKDGAARDELWAVLEAQEHTAQVNAADREVLEKRFRNNAREMGELGELGGEARRLPALVCSPTMELGIDIADLSLVYMRNVPPTPANYVQRGGRAGRAGNAALALTYCSAQSPHDQYFYARREAMVAGVIQAPKIALDNHELLGAHFNAVWLSHTEVALPQNLAELMDLTNPAALPMLECYSQPLQSEAAVTAAREAAAAMLADMRAAGAIDEAAAAQVTAAFGRKTPFARFNEALERWRDLYRAAVALQGEMARRISDHALPMKARENAEQLQRTALAQQKMLCGEQKRAGRRENAMYEYDFYTYRYLAGQGFLPGYNFPRLPLVAYLAGGGEDGERLSRPRFLALTEFGPQSFIYHRGSRYQVSQAILHERGGGEGGGYAYLPQRALRVCGACGYGYWEEGVLPDLCEACGAALGEAATKRNLYQIQDFVARRRDRISAGEEERLRQGFEVVTSYRFGREALWRRGEVPAEVEAGGGRVALTYCAAATVMRVNLGWRRGRRDGEGFFVDALTGRWAKQEGEGGDEACGTRIVPYVEDRRNVLVMRFGGKMAAETAATLRHALKLGMTAFFELEESEMAVEPLPRREDCRAFLYYESAEGGAGVLVQLLHDARLLGRVAARALELMHYAAPFDGAGALAQDGDACYSGCYRCLLSYYNQMDHADINRRDAAAVAILRALARREVAFAPASGGGGEDEGDGGGEAAWWAAARAAGWRRPDAVGVMVGEGEEEVRADYYYADSQLAVFVGAAAPAPARQAALTAAGYFLVVFPEAPAAWGEVFGRAHLLRMVGR